MSDHQKTTQAILSTQSATQPHQTSEKFALYIQTSSGLVNLTQRLTDIEERLDALEA